MTHLIVGAGFSGLPMAKKLLDLGEQVEIVDKHPGVGGLWHTGAYATAHIISSRQTTQMPDFPMPATWPDFPSRAQMGAYLQAYADAFDLTSRIRLDTEVTRVRPAGDHAGNPGWIVTFADGSESRYRTVTLATGHFSEPRDPGVPGEFAGEQLQSDRYTGPEVVAGRRVLVVGAGNTGCDAAVDASRFGASSDIAIRDAVWFFPKLFMGRPLAELGYHWPVHFDWLDRLVARCVLTFSVGDLARYGVPRPAYAPFARHPVVNTDLLSRIRHGKVAVRPGVSALEGSRVRFSDGTSAEYDLILWAIGYKVAFPMLHAQDALLRWAGDDPVMYAQMMVPGHRGLFINGLGQARTGGGPLFEVAGYMAARLAALEARDSAGAMARIDAHPLVRLLGRLGQGMVAPADMRSHGLGHLNRQIRLFNRILSDIGAPDAPRHQAPYPDARAVAASEVFA